MGARSEMTNAQYKWVITLLMVIGLALAYVNLRWTSHYGYDWTPSVTLFHIGTRALCTEGIEGVILGLLVPLCLFAMAAYMAFKLRANRA